MYVVLFGFWLVSTGMTNLSFFVIPVLPTLFDIRSQTLFEQVIPSSLRGSEYVLDAESANYYN